MRIESVSRSRRFDRDFKKLSPDLQRAAVDAIRDLMKDPVPERRRKHQLSGYWPPVHVIDVMSNHSWQITFRLEGTVAVLLRVATHHDIDRHPGQ